MSAAGRWSLHAEMQTIEQATRATALLLDVVENNPGNEALTREIARTSEAVLVLVTLRLRDIGRVLRGEVDADKLRAPHNAAVDDERDEHDVVFEPRSPKRR